MGVQWQLGWQFAVGVAVSCIMAVAPAQQATSNENPNNAWANNVSQAIHRVEHEQHQLKQAGKLASITALQGMHANLAATLALYQAEDHRQTPQSDSPKASVDADAGEKSVLEPRGRQARSRRGDDNGRRNERNRTNRAKPARESLPPQINRTLQKQQKQIEQLARKIERLERQMRSDHLHRHPPEHRTEGHAQAEHLDPRPSRDPSHAERRERAMREAEERVRLRLKFQRAKHLVEQADLQGQISDAEQRIKGMTGRRQELQRGLVQAKRRAAEANKHVETLTRELEHTGAELQQLLQQAKTATKVLKQHKAEFKQIEAERKAKEKQADSQLDEKPRKKRRSRKPNLPADAI